MQALAKENIARAAAISIALLGVLPAMVVWFAVDGGYAAYAGTAWLVLTLFTYCGICFRFRLLERTHRDYLMYRALFLGVTIFLTVYYYALVFKKG